MRPSWASLSSRTSNGVSTKLMASTGERLGRSVVAMVSSTGQATGGRTEATSTGLPVPSTPLPEIQINDLPLRFNRFEELRGIVYGSTLGFGVTSAVGGAVVTIFPPLLLSATLAALAGWAFGAWRGWSEVGDRKREEALRHTEGALLDLVQRAQTAALQHFQRRVTEWARAAIQAFGKAAEEIRPTCAAMPKPWTWPGGARGTRRSGPSIACAPVYSV